MQSETATEIETETTTETESEVLIEEKTETTMETEGATEPEPVPSYTVSACKQVTVYVSGASALNIRTKPNKNAKRIGSVSKGTALVKTGICSNGWIQIEYKGSDAFVNGKYTSTEKPKESPKTNSSSSMSNSKKNSSSSNKKMGTAGRLEIPSVGVSVPLYSGMSQSIVDAKNSAAYFTYGCQKVIADHNYQGFSAIRNCKPGTTATIYTSKGQTVYKCVKVTTGKNTGEIVDAEGNNIYSYNSGGLCMYTCADKGKINVIVTYWQP